MSLADYGLSVDVEEISPELAEKYLGNNAKHREIKQKNVDKYVESMESDNWQLNGKVLIFDSNNRLLNGQHRLTACVQSGRSFRTLVVRGIDPTVHDNK